MIQMKRLPGLRKRAAPGEEVARLHPTSLSVSMSAQPLSTATMELPQDDYAVEVGDFVEIFDSVGSLGIFRVSQLTYTYRRGHTVQLSLEHAIVTLSGAIVFGALEFDGDDTDLEIWTKLISKQPVKHWAVANGEDVEAARSYLNGRHDEMTFEDKDLMNAVLDFQAYLPVDTVFYYDFSVYPWQVIPMKNPTSTDSELRLSRNAERVTVSYDFTELVTRMYGSGGSGEDALRIADAIVDGQRWGKNYIDADTADDYGIVTGEHVDTDAKTANALYKSTKKQLDKKKNPGVTITADGEELCAWTGQPLDKFRAGWKCRLCIPEDGLTLEYQVLKVDYGDLCRAAARCTVTLGTQEKRKLSARKPEVTPSGGGGGGGGGSQTKPLTRTFTGSHTCPPLGAQTTFTIGSEFTTVTGATLRIRSDGLKSTMYSIDGSTYEYAAPNSVYSIYSYLTRSGGQIVRGSHSAGFMGFEASGESYYWTITITGTTPA